MIRPYVRRSRTMRKKIFGQPVQWEKWVHGPDINDQACYIHRLPFEILSEIFQLSTSRQDLNVFNPAGHPGDIKRDDTPLSLLFVCRKWRAVALQTSELWNSVCPSWNSITCMKFWLKVAPPIPFHLDISDPNLNYGGYPEFPCIMLRLFSSVSHRWKSLEIRFTVTLAKEFLSILDCPEKQPLPVEGLSLDMCSYAEDRLSNDIVSAILAHLSSLPYLKRLHLVTDWYNHRFDLQSIPWSRLEDITLYHGLTAKEVFSCLVQCTSAKAADFRGILRSQGYFQTEFLGRQLSTLPYLTSLILSSGGNPILILQWLSLPSIRTLCIRFDHRDLSLLDRFLARTPTLKTLLMVDEGHGDWDSGLPSDDDIIAYFLNSNLRRIPSVYLRFEKAQVRIPKVMKENPNVRSVFPSLICWEPFEVDPTEKIPFSNDVLIGWDDNLDSHPRWSAYWQFKDGRIQLPPPRRRSRGLDPDVVPL